MGKKVSMNTKQKDTLKLIKYLAHHMEENNIPDTNHLAAKEQGVLAIISHAVEEDLDEYERRNKDKA
jgi:hypothetical protein